MLMENLKLPSQFLKYFFHVPIYLQSQHIEGERQILFSVPFAFPAFKWPTENFISKSTALESDFDYISSVGVVASFYFR